MTEYVVTYIPDCVTYVIIFPTILCSFYVCVYVSLAPLYVLEIFTIYRVLFLLFLVLVYIQGFKYIHMYVRTHLIIRILCIYHYCYGISISPYKTIKQIIITGPPPPISFPLI